MNGVFKQPEISTKFRKTFLTKRNNFAFAALVVFLFTAITIGLGIELRKSRRTYSSTPVTTKYVFIYRNKGTWFAYQARHSVTQQILNDTSLAAVYMNSGDRHVFFQDPEGHIQQVVYVGSEDQWIVKTNPTGISDARYLTPLAADAQEQDVSTSVSCTFRDTKYFDH